ncbi:hypothetical protein [Bacterioplanoides sp.]|uniref:hypothetical protein n=1 Tax=Bacterioplanoides sp. TaxID=2066072 RepID=UPI003B00343F
MKSNYLSSLALLSLVSSPLAVAVESGEFCIKNEYHNQYISGTEPHLKDTCGFTEKWLFTEQPATGGYCIKNLATGKYLSDAFPGTYDACSAGELWQLEAQVAPAVQAQAQIDTQGQAVFGVSGVQTLSLEMEFNDNPVAIEMPVNAATPSFSETLYGYSASSIESLSVKFGSKTWTKNDISDRIPAVGYSAAIWFNAPIDSNTPITKMWLYVTDSEGTAELGGGACSASSCDLLGRATVEQQGAGPAILEGTLVINTP